MITPKKKIVLVGPWLGEDFLEPKWIEYVKIELSKVMADSVVIGCKVGHEHLYDELSPDRVVASAPSGVSIANKIDGKVPSFDVKCPDNAELIELRPFDEIVGKFSCSVNVYVNYYTDKNPIRDAENNFCIEKHLQSDVIDAVHLIIDHDTLVPFANKKIVLHYNDNRPTYWDFFELINEADPWDVNIVMNTDCFIDDKSLQLIKNNIEPDECWCLNRLEMKSDRVSDAVLEVVPRSSQDAWCLRGRIFNRPAFKFQLGIPCCEHKLAFQMVTSKYLVTNPSNDIRLYHNHRSNIRHYTDILRHGGTMTFVPQCSVHNRKGTKHIMIVTEPRNFVDTCVFVHHWGLGDHLIMNGAINYYMEKCTHKVYKMFCHPHYYDSVKFMYKQFPNVDIIPLSDINGNIHSNNIRKHMDRSVDRVVHSGAMGVIDDVDGLRILGDTFEESFYNQYNVNLELKWSHFNVIRDRDREVQLMQSLALPEKYIFVHDDSSRGYNIDIHGDNVVRPTHISGGTIFDWLAVIENAAEIHCIDSSFSHMIEYMNIGKNKNIYFSIRSIDPWMLPKYKNDWCVI
jgi:hypothetical protein